MFYRTSSPSGPLPCFFSLQFTIMQSRATGIADHILPLGDLLCMCLCWKGRWVGRWVWIGVGCPCPPVRNDIVTPRHLLDASSHLYIMPRTERSLPIELASTMPILTLSRELHCDFFSLNSPIHSIRHTLPFPLNQFIL